MSTLNQETRSMLEDSVNRFVQGEYTFDDRKHNLKEHHGQSPDHWHTFAEMGWLSIPFPEEQGGLGGDITDTLGVMKVFGRGMVTEPYLSVITAARLLSPANYKGEVAELLDGILSGERQVVFASEEPGSRGNPLAVALKAEPDGTGYRLSGEKIAVMHSLTAGHVLVSARSAGGYTDEQGIDLFLLALDAPGVEVTGYPMMDGHQGANITFNGVSVSKTQQLTGAGGAAALILQASSESLLMLASEAVGIMETLVRKTVAYTRTRKQFGVALAEFQVLQHRMADMYIETTSLANLLAQTASRWLEAEAPQQAILASKLKARLGPAARYVGQQAVQLHGGIGMTDELDIGHYFKRLTSIELQLGNAEWHRKRLWREIAA
ncbi:acyl-CoA dehydrogenase family protein [Marinobacter zhanjiangensis]|uniref:Acyl-CoA dehydrogenase n=1 Tax=Marinobacter zhanjiangensis TaxID=578215 RepID=A0ABQ3AJN9_9GAMM|nr:acyl-CoA dehydrogenase family protein [Marinobacter zhanjiangensis]GGY59064.1 acyl-CoA dehydrogenase [Marinobacter zhanjiangensis]